ncbi:MAG: hypothetical protein RIS29_341 [Bacteroidota bacterium]|jgi:DNA-binding MarR family transcriptional regulator
MKTKEILLELIDYLDEYENESAHTDKTLSTSDFLGFLNAKYPTESVRVNELNRGVKTEWQQEPNGPATDISILISLLFRYAKGYIKKALKDSKINTVDEFSFLITLMTRESMSKTELITHQIMEKTSGTDIINRLLKQGFIDQYDDEDDKRIIRVRITPVGRTELIAILPQMRTVSQIVAGNLTDTEKTTLAYILRKLEVFHNDIFLNKRTADLNELIPTVG